jgi:hypothetical protein
LLVLVFLAYRNPHRKISARLTFLLGLIRAAALSVILFCLMKPVVLVSSAVPLKNFVAVLCDTSKSMSIRDDETGKSRIEQAAGLLNNPKFSDALQQRFQVRYFRFADNAERAKPFETGPADGDASHIENAVRTVLGELHSVPLSGIVLITDGADNRSSHLTGLMNDLKARNVPLYTVGVGKEKIPRDVEIVRVAAPRSVLKDTLVTADVAVKNSGYEGKRVILEVREDNRIVQSKPVTLSPDDQIANYRVNFTSTRPGVHLYTVAIKPQPDEMIAENNSQEFVLRTEDAQAKVLYIEGEPRWDFKFLVRALEEDKNISVAQFLRTGKKQSLIRADSKEDLVDGFPRDRRALFKYKGLILGSVDAASFSFEQLKMMEEFVSRRGAGLLMLGAKKSFSDAGYVGTPLESVFPLSVASPSGADAEGYDVKVQLTDYGKLHPITRLSADDAENARLWNEMPSLHVYPLSVAVKPGATALLTVSVARLSRFSLPVLSFQRYGRGRAGAFLPDDSWRWRMGLDSHNKSYETFWKQMVRWIIGNASDQVTAETDRDLVPVRSAVEIKAEVNDETFTRINDAKVKARIVSGRGTSEEIPLEWLGKEDGIYRAYYQPKEEGIYAVEVSAEASKKGTILGSARTDFKAGALNIEFANPGLNRDLLRRLAQGSDGKYHDLAEADRIPEEILYNNKNNASVVVEKDLWDMPVLFLLFVGLVLGEWSVRKFNRMA